MFYLWYSDMETESNTLNPQKYAFAAALVVCILLWVGLTSVHTVSGSAGLPAVTDNTTRANLAVENPAAQKATAALGSAYLDLNLLAETNSMDEADNARWSLVRGTPGESQVYSAESGVDWGALRLVNASGSYRMPAGATWSFNATFADGPGYKIASGVLAGGHCALATVFRGAAIRANLPTHARQHLYPIPGFPLNQTVNIWWGRDDLKIDNTTSQDLNLVWVLSPGGIEISVIPVQ